MSKPEIHPQAVVASSAKLAPGVKVGAYAIVGDEAELGEGCIVHPHATVGGPAKYGPNNVFYSYCAVGGDPQDYTYHAERTELIVGDGNIFREYVTVSRGTVKGGGVTRIGNENFFLAYSHVGHDDQIGNGATLAGHVAVEDFATVGSFSVVHQFCRVGRYAYVGASTVIVQDVPPFSRVVTERQTKSYGVNTIGLERKGFSKDRLKVLDRAFRLLSRSRMNTTQALAEMRAKLAGSDDVQELIRFIETAERGIVK
jgi:UDP-N-acetylglucosamine acyltransferase